MPKKSDFNYEDKINKLEIIISKIQDENLELKKSLELYEEGIKLYRECKEYLENTKEKIIVLEETL